MEPLEVVGGGPAGAAAAIAALSLGRAVRLIEKSRFPRHKVCGEFLSPAAAEVLDACGAWDACAALRPPAIRRLVLHFGARARGCGLPGGAFGLSRYALDRLLFERAVALGAVPVRQVWTAPARPAGRPLVLAVGRRALARAGRRLFGFKAHCRGPAADSIHLFFFHWGYIGISGVENGLTNVCGIAGEHVLRAHGFRPGELLAASEALAERTAGLEPVMPWMLTGPLAFTAAFAGPEPGVYPAGDALGFIDPFTGSGILNALLTGRMAGLAAARGISPGRYLADCRHALGGAFRMAALFRRAAGARWVEHAAALVPARLLFRLTRPAYPVG